jgi:uncharacterized protein YbaR (Trm112 family)
MQDEQLLFAQIRESGVALLGSEAVVVDLKSASPVKKDGSTLIAICPSCNEAYRAADGAVCPACRGALLPYASKAVDGDDVVPVVIAR